VILVGVKIGNEGRGSRDSKLPSGSIFLQNGG
jgi:hypothetical protein